VAASEEPDVARSLNAGTFVDKNGIGLFLHLNPSSKTSWLFGFLFPLDHSSASSKFLTPFPVAFHPCRT
jgi:hypothetical protein